MSLLMAQRMVNMKVIVTRTCQRDTQLIDKIVMPTNMISMNHIVMIDPKAKLANSNHVAMISVGLFKSFNKRPYN